MDVLLAESVGETRDVYRPNVSSYDAPNMNEAPSDVVLVTPETTAALETLSIFSGKDEQFAFKRALSRLLEMTSESYVREEQWTPLPEAVRKWEKSSFGEVAKSTVIGASTSGTSTQPPHDLEDFAAEAEFASPGQPDTSLRPEAPQLREEHVWGVRDDWGKRAGKWGRGATVHSGQPSTNSEDPSRK